MAFYRVEHQGTWVGPQILNHPQNTLCWGNLIFDKRGGLCSVHIDGGPNPTNFEFLASGLVFYLSHPDHPYTLRNPVHPCSDQIHQAAIRQLGALDDAHDSTDLVFQRLLAAEQETSHQSTDPVDQITSPVLVSPSQPGLFDTKTIHELAALIGTEQEMRSRIASGVNISKNDHHHCTPLFRAAEAGNLPVVNLLLDAGANPDVHGNGGYTALHTAAGQKPEIIEALLKASKEVNARDQYGNTPLHFAVGNPEVCLKLLKAGASIMAVNIHGQTPLDLARVRNQETVVKLFENGKQGVQELGTLLSQLSVTEPVQIALYNAGLCKEMVQTLTESQLVDFGVPATAVHRLKTSFTPVVQEATSSAINSKTPDQDIAGMPASSASSSSADYPWDGFISHAGSDPNGEFIKALMARPLADFLSARGYEFFIDELHLQASFPDFDMVRAAINCQVGVVILSDALIKGIEPYDPSEAPVTSSSSIIQRRLRPWCLLELRILLAKHVFLHQQLTGGHKSPSIPQRPRVLFIPVFPIVINEFFNGKPLPLLEHCEFDEWVWSFLELELEPGIWKLFQSDTLAITASNVPFYCFGPNEKFRNMLTLCEAIYEAITCIIPPQTNPNYNHPQEHDTLRDNESFAVAFQAYQQSTTINYTVNHYNQSSDVIFLQKHVNIINSNNTTTIENSNNATTAIIPSTVVVSPTSPSLPPLILGFISLVFLFLVFRNRSYLW